MSARLDDALRATFAGLADVLIPAAEGMPAASAVQVQGPVLDRILELRSDLAEDFLRGLKAASGRPPDDAANDLDKTDAAALRAVGLVASAAYFMDPRVRALIGYPGQEKRPADPDVVPEYVANGMLDEVRRRGPIFRPTPEHLRRRAEGPGTER